jgi:hypothetical protein
MLLKVIWGQIIRKLKVFTVSGTTGCGREELMNSKKGKAEDE